MLLHIYREWNSPVERFLDDGKLNLPWSLYKHTRLGPLYPVKSE